MREYSRMRVYARARASETTAPALLSAQENCSKSLFEKAIRGNYLGTTVLCFALLCFTSHRACNARVHKYIYIYIYILNRNTHFYDKKPCSSVRGGLRRFLLHQK